MGASRVSRVTKAVSSRGVWPIHQYERNLVLPRVMAPSYSDRRERRLREFDFPRGCRVKVVS
jgi:hypothetical protein